MHLKGEAVMDVGAEPTQVIGNKKGKSQGKHGSKKKNTESVQGDETSRGRRDPNWSPQETTLLLDLLAEIQSGKQDGSNDGGYNDQEWSYVCSMFNKKNTKVRALASLKQRWKNLKGDFSFFWGMANRSGCGWNEEANIPDVPEDAWEHLKEKDNVRYKKYVKKTFPWFRQVEALYGKNIASGRSNITFDANKPISRNFTEVSSSEENDDAQPDLDEFSLPEFQEMMADGIETIAPEIEENDGARDPISEPIHVDVPPVVPAPTQNRKRSNNTHGEPSRRTKSKESANRMDEFAEKFLFQQHQRTEIIAQSGQANRVIHDQVIEKLNICQSQHFLLI